jgi:hypothetical protein
MRCELGCVALLCDGNKPSTAKSPQYSSTGPGMAAVASATSESIGAELKRTSAGAAGNNGTRLSATCKVQSGGVHMQV